MILWILTVALALTGCGGDKKGKEEAQGVTAVAEDAAEAEASSGSFVFHPVKDGHTSLSRGKASNVKAVTVSATGDCAIGRVQVHAYAGSFEDYYDRNGPDYFFDNVRDVFEQDDFTLVNCECVLTERNSRVDKEYNIRGKPEYAAIFSGSSVEGATLGNNHSADYGPESLEDTKKALTDAGISWAINDSVGRYVTPEGIRIGFVSASLLGDFARRSAYMENGLKSLRDEVDLLIACPHMGTELQNYAGAAQIEFFHNCVDWGADLVIGNHPHVLEGCEVYNGKVIMYSLGNFCFGANHNPKDYDTVIFQQTFSFVDGKPGNHINAKIIPCSVSSEQGNNNYQPRIYSDPENIARIIGKVNDFSEPLESDAYFNEAGYLVTR